MRQFERQFTDDGMVVIKFFLAITQKEQKKRMDNLKKNASTKWRVNEEDYRKNKDYDKYLKKYDDMLIQTDTSNAPWTVVEAIEKKYAICKILTTVVNRLEAAVSAQKKVSGNAGSVTEEDSEDLQNGVLQGIDLSLTLEPEEYKKKRKDLQKRMEILHNKMYLQRVPVILAFEGWDAGGKGGAIKRISTKFAC